MPAPDPRYRSTAQLRRDALAIWHSGLDGVDSHRLVRESLRREDHWLLAGDESFDLKQIRRLVVVGAGKAGAGMAAAVEEVLGSDAIREKKLTGWVNVPEDCVRPLAAIHLHPARPAGLNEPTAAGVQGSEQILKLVRSVGPHDLCLCLLSGGGSALMPAPIAGVSLDDKAAVTRFLSSSGATIEQLNTVRKQLSRIKGGGLARACGGGVLLALVISDVLGDPLDVIASGPTVPDRSTAADALAVLSRFGAGPPEVPASLVAALERRVAARNEQVVAARTINLVIGNNAIAVDSAGQEAVRRGYSPAMTSARGSEGPAEDVGRHLARMARRMLRNDGPDCLISGGEPVVKLAPAAIRGRGGRNQQLVLAALEELWADGGERIALVSGGTDGEDGPTDAAGAVLDAHVVAAAQARGMAPRDYLQRNDAYRFFGPLDALVKTGPTHTNVCDLRVVVVARGEIPGPFTK